MSAIVLHCPGCDQAYRMQAEQIAKYSGKTITCKKCKSPINFDAAMDVAAKAAGEAEAAGESKAQASVPAAAKPPKAPPQISEKPAAANKPAPAMVPSALASALDGEGPSDEDEPARPVVTSPAQASWDPGDVDGPMGDSANPPAPLLQQQGVPDAPAESTPAAPLSNTAAVVPGKKSMRDYLTFRAMITPGIISLIFWLLVLLSIGGAIAQVVGGINLLTQGVPAAPGLFVSAVATLVLGPLVARILCEILIVVFEIYNTLVEIRDRLGPR